MKFGAIRLSCSLLNMVVFNKIMIVILSEAKDLLLPTLKQGSG
jgi:hypothetical protein